MKTLSLLGRRLFHGPEYTALLRRCGIEPRRYWILVDLFEMLGKRQEVAQTGSDAYSMRILVIFWFFLSGVLGVVMGALGATAGVYLLVFLALTAFQLSMLLITEIAEGLVNPVEGLILAHQPVNGATWLAAKLTHLIKIVVYVVAGVNGVPAFIPLLGPSGEGFRPFVYPITHLLTALGVGLVVGFLCCSLFGWLVRFVPVRRLKAAAAMVQVIPMLIAVCFQFLSASTNELWGWVMSIELPEAWLVIGDKVPGGPPALLAVVALPLTTVAVVLGVRALSGDHLIRVSSLMHSGARVGQRDWRRWKVGPWIAWHAGGQSARAGFDYLCSMALRDWQFRKNMAMNTPHLFICFIVLLVVGAETTPFAAGFAYTHLLPHLIGTMALITCLYLGYGNDHKAVWWFSIVPDSSFRPFVRGIHAGLWFLLVAVPNFACLLVLAWSWGVRDALWVIAFSTAVTSFDLAVGLRLIDGLPFGKQTPPAREVVTLPMTMIYLVVLSVAIGIQYLVFRSVVAVAAVTIIVSVGTYFLTRSTLANFESRIRLSLNPGAARQFLAFVQPKTP
ncbi:MAG: hypothetical protein OXH11_01895 [Candidatus Aminicenantes bacterium]|nr:hypothetical protein [Candidatus Aminicenantes bacterium]